MLGQYLLAHLGKPGLIALIVLGVIAIHTSAYVLDHMFGSK